MFLFGHSFTHEEGERECMNMYGGNWSCDHEDHDATVYDSQVYGELHCRVSASTVTVTVTVTVTAVSYGWVDLRSSPV